MVSGRVIPSPLGYALPLQIELGVTGSSRLSRLATLAVGAAGPKGANPRKIDAARASRVKGSIPVGYILNFEGNQALERNFGDEEVLMMAWRKELV